MISPGNMNLLISMVNTTIRSLWQEVPIFYPKIMTTVPCSTEFFVDAWIGRMPKMREWLGPRVAYEPARQTYTAQIQNFEGTYTIDRFELDDDKYGVVYAMLPDMAYNGKCWPEFTLRDWLEGLGSMGTSARQLGLDGLSHWNTAHPVNIYQTTAFASSAIGATYTNDSTGGGYTATVYTTGSGTTTKLIGGALTPSAVSSVVEYQMLLPDESGELHGLVPDTIMVPALLKVEGEVVVKNVSFAPPTWGYNLTSQVGAADNPIKRFGLDLLVNPRLRSQTVWYSLVTNRSVKPFRWIERTPLVGPIPRTAETDPVVFDNHRYTWGDWGRATVAPAMPFLSHRSGP